MPEQTPLQKILLITNGHGEDEVAAVLVREFRKKTHTIEFLAEPLVGNGNSLEVAEVELLGPRKAMPSGGFIHHNLRGFFGDIFRGGLLSNLWQHVRSLRRQKGRVQLTICVGDMIPAFAAWLVGAPIVLVGINKSDYYQYYGYSYTGIEVAFLRRFARLVFTRDAVTAERLSRRGVPAKYVGNPMMDCMDGTAIAPSPTADRLTIGFLPGTRTSDIPKNLEDFQKVIQQLTVKCPTGKSLRFLVSLKENGFRVLLTQEMIPMSFSTLLAESDIVIGLSGTGNEQAAGVGRPVIAFPSRGQQYNVRYGKAQQQLLGEALELCPRDPSVTAEHIIDILQNPKRMETMTLAGRMRMGTRGAVARIVEQVLQRSA